MYLIDTSFIGTVASVYPRDVFPSLWVQLEEPIFRGDSYFHKTVDKEMKEWKDRTLDWYLKHIDPQYIVSTDDNELALYTDVVRWVANKRQPRYKDRAVNVFMDAADSWLIASALRHDATIVTNEVRAAPDSRKQVKIPDVADHFGVRCIDLLAFLREMKISI
ncbi:DUF4411 family protein [Corynebacterium hiratae]|uniref:DUF4411 family protein n=1 Tax=Corynebacterium hiratae TaxID=3139423 RepID=A0A553FXF4_9CORY|nr:DUF4411 family protein [Corynebacterium aurimucosum]TRX61936.1 DUF4411 family protein [Corynebacterium aurimucosum]